MASELPAEFEDKLKKTISTLKKDLSKLRTGVASISLLEDIRVAYYGQPTPLNQMATIAAPDSQDHHHPAVGHLRHSGDGEGHP